jgi:periplasmic protein TonB
MLDYNSPKVTLDDIVFEDRNKVYGAYILRKKYDDSVVRALILAGTVFTLAVTSPLIWSLVKPSGIDEKPTEVVVDLAKLPPPPPSNPKLPPPPPMPSAPPPPAVKTIKFTPPEVAPDEEVIEEPPKLDEIKKAAISNTYC